MGGLERHLPRGRPPRRHLPETSFWPHIATGWGYGTTRSEDLVAETAEHPFLDALWASKAPELERITVPAYVVASWSDQGLHSRGTLEGFKRISSGQKWLEVHGGKKWGYYYSERGLARQQAFFDHFLKGLPTEVAEWPRVRYEVRERAFAGRVKTASDWPLPEVEPVRLHLDAEHGTLVPDPPAAEASVAYDSQRTGRARGRATFDLRFEEPCELVGNVKLRLWVSSPEAEDMDLFVALQKLDRWGDHVGFPYYAVFVEGPVALGWLRVSHRELDEERSTPAQPVLAHRRALPLQEGEIVPVEIEILPSGTRFEAGETLRLVVQGKDVYRYPRPLTQTFHDESVNRGRHVLHTGGRFDSHLLVPRLPASG